MGPLAQIAKQAGYEVSGSDKQASQYIDNLKAHGIDNIHIGQTTEQIAQVHQKQPIDWLVYTPAVTIENPDHPELTFAKQNGIKTGRYDELLNKIISDHKLKLIAIAGTHGKTTTTAMVIWLFKQLGIPISYSVGAKISFGDMGEFDPRSKYFVLEADEFERKFLTFHPYLSLISGIDWDHPDIFPTREEYYRAFRDFIKQSRRSVLWHGDAKELKLPAAQNIMLLHDSDEAINKIKLLGKVNRLDACLAAKSLYEIVNKPLDDLIATLNNFPGLSRRFEEITPGLKSDYAHTPSKIRGALQMAQEVAGQNVVVVYEGLHNLRQHFIKDDLKNLFDNVKRLYVVPSYLAREDQSLKLLKPVDLLDLLSNKSRQHAETAQLNPKLKKIINKHLAAGDLVLALSAGSGGSLDEWLRREFRN